MRKAKTPIDLCKCGSILASDVYNDKGSLIIANGAVLSESILRSLKILGISDLCIIHQDECKKNAGAITINEFRERYTIQTKRLNRIADDLITGKELRLDDLTEIIDEVCHEIHNNSNIISYLHEMKKYDENTFTHCLNVAFYSALICKWTGTDPRKTRNVIMTALLHDIGKLMIPSEIINKKDKLLPEEQKIMRMHVIHGYNLVKDKTSIDSDIKLGIMMHHKRENGTGYPSGLKYHQLNLNTKIVSIADVYDALISDRPYRKAYTPFRAFHIMKNENLLSFDVDILNSFLSTISYYYIGAKVLLNNGTTGEIVHIPSHSIERPVICVNGKYIDLSRERSLEIASLL